jgi:hypothetical protein
MQGVVDQQPLIKVRNRDGHSVDAAKYLCGGGGVDGMVAQ